MKEVGFAVRWNLEDWDIGVTLHDFHSLPRSVTQFVLSCQEVQRAQEVEVVG